MLVSVEQVVRVKNFDRNPNIKNKFGPPILYILHTPSWGISVILFLRHPVVRNRLTSECTFNYKVAEKSMTLILQLGVQISNLHPFFELTKNH